MAHHYHGSRDDFIQSVGEVITRIFQPVLPDSKAAHTIFRQRSKSDPRIRFGLGTASKWIKIEIQWPSGRKQEIAVAQG